MERGINPYVGKNWELVQTHIIDLDDKATELWRPGNNTGTDDPYDLERALKEAVEMSQLDIQVPMDPPVNKRLADIHNGGILVETVIRTLPQKNLEGGGPFAIDWVYLNPEIINQLIPSESAIFPIALPEQTAIDILIHLRPPIETAEDHSSHAMPLIKHARLEILAEEVMEGHRYVRLAGRMHLKKDPFPSPVRDHIRWEIVENYIEVEGFLKIDASGSVVDFQLLTTEGLFLPPHQKLIKYDAVTHVYKEPKSKRKKDL